MSSAAAPAVAGVEPGQQTPTSLPNPTPGATSWQPPASDSSAAQAASSRPQGIIYNGTQPQPPHPPVVSSSRVGSHSPGSGHQTTPHLSNGNIATVPSANIATQSPAPAYIQAQQANSQPAATVTYKEPARSPATGDNLVALEQTAEYNDVCRALGRAPPSIVRQAIRDMWEKTLKGSEYHHAFLTYSAFARATPAIIDRAFQDFGSPMLNSAKQPLVERLTAADYDELADTILANVSNKFLDKAMAKRLETIRARELVNALARAERLGYDVQDIVEEKSVNGVELVIPSLGPMNGLHTPTQPSHGQSYRPPPSSAPPAQPAYRHAIKGQVASSPQGVIAGTQEEEEAIVHCSKCSRPCSGPQALRYHTARRACHNNSKFSRIGKEVCAHCGCSFTSGTGLLYHVKCKVCGDYSEEIERAVLTQLHAMYPQLSPPPMPPVRTPSTVQYTPQRAMQNATPAQASATVTPHGSVTWVTPSTRVTPGTRSTPSGPEDPYSRLTPEARRNFEAEMKQAEEKYGGLMREAMKLPRERREEELAKLKNSYNTKQSVTRKKYGIRLRERRSKAEIEREKFRLFGPDGQRRNDGAPSPKRPRLSSNSDSRPSSGQAIRNTPVPIPTIPSSGLMGSSGPAEHTDPTTLITPSQPRSIANVQAEAQTSTRKGTLDDPMQIDDGSSDGTESDSDSDDDDIPAKIS